MTSGGGRFDFDDGGTYCGGWEDGKAHGHGVCTGPKGQGEYSGAWQYGFEISGVYTWPSGNNFEGQWFQGKRHGLGVEVKGRWVYRGEWTQGFKGRYGVRQSTSSGARYEGTWTTGLQDGYGCETYADGVTKFDGTSKPDAEFGSYQGQWLRGMRHGYGVRQSVPYGLASHYRPKALRDSLTSLRSENEDEQVVKNRDKKLDESRGGFVLKAKSDETPPARRRSLFDRKGNTSGGSLRKTIFSGLKLKKQKSTGDINDSPKRQTGSVRSTISNISHVSADSTQSGMTNASVYTDSNLSFVSQDDITDVNVTETYMGEWKNDKRSGFGISERSDGLKYNGEWYNNKKYGYGVTVFKDGTKEEGKYKNNVLISSGKKNKLFLIRTSKLRERVDNAVLSSQRAAQIALQKADIAITRMANARAKAEQADAIAQKARQDSDIARLKAKEYAPEFHQPGTDILRKKIQDNNGEALEQFEHLKPVQNHNPGAHQRSKSVMHKKANRGDIEAGENFNGLSPITTLSSALDCALAGSRSKLGPPQGHHDVEQIVINSTHLQVEPQLLNVNYHSPKGSAENMSASTPSHSRSPSLKIRRYSFLAGSRRGRGFSELFNSTILNDHFDQYATHTCRDDSGLGREFMSADDRTYKQGASASDTSPDSGVSETMDDDNKNRPMPRRRTLPCIMKEEDEESKNTQKVPQKETAHSNENIAKKDVETYIIENGIRKRVRAEIQEHNPTTVKQSGALPKMFRVGSEKNLSRKNRGSLPDINAVKEKIDIMPREEVYKLSSARREELRRLQDLEEKRRQGDVTVILGDLKDWCQQRQLLVLVIALNVSLATMFFNLLS